MKRSQPENSTDVPTKKACVASSSVSIGSVSCLEEMDIKVLKFQNQKLAESIEARKQAEDNLKLQLAEEREQKKVILDMLAVVNRHWYQLDSDLAVMLQRYQPPKLENKEEIKQPAVENAEKPEQAAEQEKMSTSEESDTDKTKDKDAVESVSSEGVEQTEKGEADSVMPVIKVEAADGETQSSVKSEGSDAVKEQESPTPHHDAPSESEWTFGDSSSETTLSFIKHLSILNKDQRKEELQKKVSYTQDVVKKLFNVCEQAYSYKKDVVQFIESSDLDKIEAGLKKQVEDLVEENKRLQDLISSLQDKHHTVSLEFSEIRDKYASSQQEISELNTRLQDAEYDMTKANHRVDRLIKRLNEVETKCVKLPEEGSSSSSINMTPAQIEELQSQLQEQTELSTGRLEELQKLQEDHKNALQDIERLKLELKQVPESVIIQSAPYKSLQTNFSLLYNEATQMRQQSEETKKMLMASKTQHLIQLEQLESDFLTTKKKFKSELSQSEDALMLVRRDYEMLRMDFEQNLKSNEQTGPLTKEMHHLINSLQNHNHQLKGEVMRYKRKLTEAQDQIAKLEKEAGEKPETPPQESESDKPKDSNEKSEPEKSKEEGEAEEKEEGAVEDHDQEEGELEKDSEEPGPTEADCIKELKAQLKKAEENVKETKLVLDVYKGATKDMREKVELLTAEKKLKADIEALKTQVQELQVELELKKGAMADEEALRKLKMSDETIEQLQKNLAATKQEEDALLAEMEFTGQAFEEMQEQNVRLLQQLREKDDANLKLMSERIKANQIQKQLREEKDILADQMTTLNAQRDAQLQVLKKYEEREKALQSTLNSIEKELGLRQQVMDMHKRKALESAQAAQDLKLRLESCQLHLQEVEKALNDKVTYIEDENFRMKRVQEEAITLRRKLDKHKKMEYYGAADEILMEEIKMYKAKLTCPCCNSRKKDAILTKCYHVFCFECLKTRYDTRQRKCPKCNATFGNNDFHKMYL